MSFWKVYVLFYHLKPKQPFCAVFPQVCSCYFSLINATWFYILLCKAIFGATAFKPLKCHIMQWMPLWKVHINQFCLILPILSLPLQEEKCKAVLPLSSAAQGSVSSSSNLRTKREKKLIIKDYNFTVDQILASSGTTTVTLMILTCVNIIGVGSFSEPLHSLEEKTIQNWLTGTLWVMIKTTDYNI